MIELGVYHVHEVILKTASIVVHHDAWGIRVFCSKFTCLQYKYSLCRVEYTCSLNLQLVASISAPQFCENMNWWTAQVCGGILIHITP